MVDGSTTSDFGRVVGTMDERERRCGLVSPGRLDGVSK